MSWLLRRLNEPLLALGAAQFALGMLQTTFMFYYVKVYLNVFKIDDFWFTMAQGLFLVWNAINDPLFGYWQDSASSWMNSRRLVLRYFAPCIGFSFILLWRRAPYEQGVHLIIALFLYDAFFSAIGVAWSAMFAEIEGGVRGRAAAMKYSQIASLLSVNVIAVAEKVSHSLENFSAFQWMSVCLAVVAVSFLLYASWVDCSSHFLPTSSSSSQLKERLLDDDVKRGKEEPMSLRTVKDVLSRRDFFAIVVTNFIHNARSVCHINFASIMTELLIPQTILPKGSLALSLFYGVCTLLPQLLVIAAEQVVVRRGAHRLAQDSFVLTVIGAAGCFLLGSSPWVVMIFMLLDSVAVHASSPLFNILFSEFIEDDCSRNVRRKPISSLVFGLNALFVKPAQSIGPLLVVWFLNRHGYEAYKQHLLTSTDLVESARLILFLPPLFLAACQYIAFTSYSLGERNRRATVVL